MANEIKLGYRTGLALYAIIQNAAGQYYNTVGAAFESYNAANWGDYDVTLAETGVSGSYMGTFPVVAAGLYRVEARRQAGGSPAVGDDVIGEEDPWGWSGTAKIDPALASSLAELSAVPAPTATLRDALAWLLAWTRNKKTQSSTTETLFKDDGSTTLATSSRADSGGVFTKGEYS